MAFGQKILQINQEFKDWLNETFAPFIHRHDDLYLPLSYTPPKSSTIFDPTRWSLTQVHTLYTIYNTPCDGWLRGSCKSGQVFYLVTHALGLFDQSPNNERIALFDQNIAYKQGDLIKLGLSYYQCISNTSAGQSPATHPSKWTDAISEHTPCIFHTIVSHSSEHDAGDSSVLIPVAKGTKCMLACTGDGLGNPKALAAKPGESDYQAMMSFIPFSGSHTQKLTDTGIKAVENLRIDTKNQVLAGLFIPYHS